MRHLLKTKFEVARFATLKQIIKRKSKEIKNYEKMHGIEFEKHLKNLMIGQRADLRRTNKIAKDYQKICLSAGKPLETMLKQFVDHSKKYNEDDLVHTVVYLGKAYQMSLIDHGGHLDRFDHKLIKSPMFDHFIEEVKYALSDKAYISTENIVKVLDGLSQLNYLDYEIVMLVTAKIENYLEPRKQQKVKFDQRLYQSEKKDYYKSNLIGFNDALVKNKKFNKNLQYFQTKKKQLSVKQPLNSLDKSFLESSDAYEDIVNILSEYSKMNNSVDKLVQAVLAVRRQYSKLVTISKNQKVIRNPELNSAALLVEEKLIEMHLITIEDVEKPEKIPIDPKEIQKVEGIVHLLMSEANAQNFEDFIVGERYNLEYISENKQKNLLEYSALLQSFAKYVNIPYRLYGTEDGMSLLNVKWQRYFIGQDFKQNNIQVERGFRKAFIETQVFFNKHLNVFDLSFIEAKLKSKIRWYSAMIEMGFIEQVHNYFKEMKFVPNMLNSLDEKETFLLTKILNNSCQAEYKLDPQVHQWIQKKVESIIDQGSYVLSIGELTDTINYLYQASNTKKCELNQSLYSTLLELLAQEVNYVEQSPTSNKVTVREAKRILMLQSLQSSPYAGGFESLSQSQNPSDPKCSPYLKALYQTLNMSLNSANTPFVMTGINENNEPCGVYIANSDCSSFSGDMNYGNINAFCQRLWKRYQVRVSSIGVNKLLNITYPQKFTTTVSRNVTIGLKTSNEILSAFTPYLSRNNLALTEFIKTMTSILVSSNSAVSPSTLPHYKARKLLHSMKKLLALSNNEKQIFLMNQFYAKRCQMLLQFHKFKKQIGLLLNQEDRDKIENTLTLRNKKDQKVKLDQLIANVEKELEKNFGNIQAAFKKMQDNNKNTKQINFKGKRISLNLLEPSSQSLKIQNPSQVLLSTPYLLDNRYIEYKDWQSLIKKTFNYNQISLQSASDTTKLLARKFCPQAIDTLVALPNITGEMVVPYYPINWQAKYRNYMENKEQKEQMESIAENYRSAYKNRQNFSQKQNQNIKYTARMLNFKHELKANKSPQQILKFLTSFDFIDDLMNSKLSPGEQSKQSQPSVFLDRDSESYFSYLQNKSDKTYLQSPYLRYVFSKLEQSEQLKSAMEEHRLDKSKLLQEYQVGTLDRKLFLTNMNKLDKKLIEQAKKLRNKSLTRTEGHRPQMLEDGSKIVQFNKDIEAIERVINSNGAWYDRDDDTDLVIAAGNYDRALEIKRAKAETNFILFKILANKGTGQALTEQQKKFLTVWKSSITNPKQSKLNNSFTQISLSSLSKADHQSLITTANLPKHCPNLALSDVILELSHFFEEAVIQKLEAEVINEQVTKKYGIPESVNIFASSSNNKIARKFNYEMEDYILDKQAQLKEKDIETIIEMSKIFKTEALSDREKYNLHYRNLRQDLDTMNKCSFRTPLISEYLKQKDYEYFNNLHPADAYALKKQSTDKLWLSIFNKPVTETSSTLIRSVISQLCQMMLVFKSDLPPFFSSLVLQILQHENTDTSSKQKLIAYLELFKINIQLDSQDLLDLATETKRGKEEVLQDLKKWCNEDVQLRLFGKSSDLAV